MPRPGQTLVGAETVIARFGDATSDLFDTETEDTAPTPEAEEAEEAPIEAELVIDEDDELTLEELGGGDKGGADEEDEDVSEMFARLRKEAKKIQDDE